MLFYIVFHFQFSKMRFSLINKMVTLEKGKFPIISNFPILDGSFLCKGRAGEQARRL